MPLALFATQRTPWRHHVSAYRLQLIFLSFNLTFRGRKSSRDLYSSGILAWDFAFTLLLWGRLVFLIMKTSFLRKKFAKNFQKRTRVDSECGYEGVPPWYGEAQAESFYLPT